MSDTSNNPLSQLRQKLRRNPVLKFMSSIKITVLCIFLLFVLTLWGTIAQVDTGLYLAQKKYFYSWFFLLFNFLPFPGAQLVLWVLFLNLVSVAITRLVYKISHLGILIIHFGLLLYFVGAFVIFNVCVESNMTLLNGETSNVSSAYHDWEISVWEDTKSDKRIVKAIDASNISIGDRLPLLSMAVKAYYPNSQAFSGKPIDDKWPTINSSGITYLEAAAYSKEPEKNTPGIILDVPQAAQKHAYILLFAGDPKPTSLKIDDQTYNFQLRQKRYQLPFSITLKKFDKEFHPNTEIAKKYQSLVELDHDGVSREILIFMNNPLRFQDYALYQASYSVDQMGRERSTLAVVKNAGRMLPYVASLLTFAGMVVHFLVMALIKERTKNA